LIQGRDGALEQHEREPRRSRGVEELVTATASLADA
jgi:hypothetical protein